MSEALLIFSLCSCKPPVGQIVCTDKGILAVEQNKVLIPPTWNKTFAWGYADLSCRLGTYESDKVLIVYECLSEWGQILCAICPSPKLVITGGTSTAVCVWEMGISKEKAKALTLKQALLGHTDTVTCLTASLAYHIIVSGSRDRTCIIWDLNKLSFLTQLRGHRAPVSALCINELTVRNKHPYAVGVLARSITQTDNLHFSQINTAVPSSISHQHCKPLITFGSVYYLFKEKIADSISIFLSVTLNFKHDTFTETVFGTSVCYCSLH
uniref:WDFY family member 4 n=1 Tax=Meleagris gallopavo TaxID=9103 RepID=A0A803XYT0_MELGA